MNNNKYTAVITGILIGALCIGALMFNPGVSWAPPLIRVGVVNWEQVVMNFENFQRDLSELEQRRDRLRQYIEEQYGELGDEELEDVDKEVEEIYGEAIKQLNENRRRKISEYHQKIYSSIESEAVAGGYSLILSENEVLYASEEYTDLTQDVINRLNNE
ncbi:MAG: OmpH family outer membrane protein [bacterium]